MSIYVGDSNDIARTAKKLYVGGNGGIARSVIRAYAGDENNIARMVFGSPQRLYIIENGALAAYWIRQATPKYNSSYTGVNPDRTFEDGYMDMYFSGNKCGNLNIQDRNKNRIDFTDYQKICIDYYVGNANAKLALSLQASENTYISSSEYLLDNLNSTTRTTAVFDISAVTGVQYFFLNMRTTASGSSTRHAYIYNLWIE